jgi:hypothetical protein
MSAGDMARLKAAGISDETLAILIREKSIETAALSVPQIEALRAAGVSDATIRTLAAQGSFLKDAAPVVYGQGLRHVSLSTSSDLIELKRAGLSEEVLQAIVIAASPRADDLQRAASLELLRQLGLVIDAAAERRP